MKMIQINFEAIIVNQETSNMNNEVSIRNLKTQIEQLAKHLMAQSNEDFLGNTHDNPLHEI